MAIQKRKSIVAAEPAQPPWPWLLGGLAVLAGTLRLIHARALANDSVFAVLLGDSKRYVEWAAEIAGGNWLGSSAF